MNITYEYYKIFYYVAKYKSFTGAAKVLMNNQPNITRAMNNLEQQLGCILFIRSNHGVTLTPEGNKLFSYVSVAYKQLRAAELEITNSNNLENGTISVSETALHGILLDVLEKFHRDYPNIHIQILSNTTPRAIQAVHNGMADFCVVTTPLKLRKPLKGTPLREFHEILVGSPRYAHLTNHRHSLQDLQEYPLVSLSKNTMTHSYLTSIYLREHMVLEPEVEVSTADQLIPIISRDLGIGFVPDFLAQKPLRDGHIVEIPLSQTLPTRYIYLVEDLGHPLSIAATKLKDMLLGYTP